MATRNRQGSGSPSRNLETAARQLRAVFDEMSQQGHPASLELGLDKVAEQLGIPRQALAPMSQVAEGRARARKEELGRELRNRAEDAGCAYSYKPPLIHFGCVTFRQDPRDQDAWSVTVLGADPVERLLGHDPDQMTNAAMNVIDSVESVLSRVEGFLQDVEWAYELLNGSVGTSDGVSPNLLLLLASRGKRLKKDLMSPDNLSPSGLSRAQGGFLLRKASQLRDESGIRIRLRPATQHVAADSWRFVPVPEEATPRSQVVHTPVGRVFIDKKEGS